MCTTCGCAGTEPAAVTDLKTGAKTVLAARDHDHPHGHDHDHMHEHGHSHRHSNSRGDVHADDHHHRHEVDQGHHHIEGRAAMHAGIQGRTVQLEQELLAKNRLIAERTRGWFHGREVLAVNLMSSPGAGKTTLLEKTIGALSESAPVYVVEGDQATLNDAERIKATGAAVTQINTGTGCHLDADMLARGIAQLNPRYGALVFIENVGNLICPALFDLGEDVKVVILSVTEGEDKPVKYPHMFRACELVLISKVDLLPHLRFDVDRCIAYARQVNPGIQVLQVSSETGEGLEAWRDWLHARRARLGTTHHAPR